MRIPSLFSSLLLLLSLPLFFSSFYLASLSVKANLDPPQLLQLVHFHQIHYQHHHYSCPIIPTRIKEKEKKDPLIFFLKSTLLPQFLSLTPISIQDTCCSPSLYWSSLTPDYITILFWELAFSINLASTPNLVMILSIPSQSYIR